VEGDPYMDIHIDIHFNGYRPTYAYPCVIYNIAMDIRSMDSKALLPTSYP